jgi:hypothetical protein
VLVGDPLKLRLSLLSLFGARMRAQCELADDIRGAERDGEGRCGIRPCDSEAVQWVGEEERERQVARNGDDSGGQEARSDRYREDREQVQPGEADGGDRVLQQGDGGAYGGDPRRAREEARRCLPCSEPAERPLFPFVSQRRRIEPPVRA